MQEELELIAESLNIKPLPTAVDLGERGIGDGYVGIFADALRHHSTLAKVNLRWNNLGDKGAIAFAEVLETNVVLKQLILRGNNIEHEGALALACALEVNHTLESLDLSYNTFTAISEEAITKLLNTKTLISLSLRGCGLKVIAIKLLAEELKLNQTLKSLDCKDNHIEPDGLNLLLLALQANYSLVRFSINLLHLPEPVSRKANSLRIDCQLRNTKLAVIDHAIQMAWMFEAKPYNSDLLNDYAQAVIGQMEFGHRLNFDMLMFKMPLNALLMSIIALRHAPLNQIATHKAQMLHHLKTLVAACGVDFDALPNRFSLKKFARFFEDNKPINRQRFSLFINRPTPSFNRTPKPKRANI